MIKIPECLSKRYKALDDIIQELSMSISSQRSLSEQRSNTSNVGIKLMCDFWNILREDPDCNLTAEVQQRMGMGPGASPQSTHNVYGVQRYITYMAGCRSNDNNKRCGAGNNPQNRKEDELKATGASYSGSSSLPRDGGMALSKVLCNLKEAATFDKKCHERVKDLMEAQKELKNQIQILEYREREGVKLLKEADCMWLCMEDAYKKKVGESQDRQQILLKQLKEIEASASKWRKNKKDLEFQIDNMTKARMEIVEKVNQKKNDVRIMDTEVKNLARRVESAKKDLENSKKSMASAKQASDARMSNLTSEMVKIQKRTNEERALMKKKEEEGTQYVKDTRIDLQNICKVLLQKKLENEDLRAERTALLEEIDLLTTTLNTCKDKCQNKEKSVFEELKTLNNEIATFVAKCKKCHICTDTNDVRKLCTDCPKCMQERGCKYGDEICTSDPTMDCVCMSVKQRFLDNVFDNMYTVLERQSKTQPGKALADAILKSLRRSANGKLPPEIRGVLQEFILSTVKKNLNLTIVGGAVKTRCELDPDTYKQLMTCLKSVKEKKPPQEDKGTASKKDPCKRWGASSECNCPKGPKDCVCTKKAPPHPKDPTPCPQDKEDIGEQKICPFKERKVCGPDCGMQGQTSKATRDIGNEIATWRRDPCSGPSCPNSKITRAALAQCVIGPESMEKTVSRKGTCSCKTPQLKSSYSNRDTKHLKVQLAKCCDRTTSVPSWRDIQKDVRFEVPCVKQEFNIQTDAIGLTDKKQSLVGVACQFNNLDSFSTDRTQEKRSKEFKIVIRNNSGGELRNQITVLTKTRSGTLAMELDEQTIELIQNQTIEKPFLIASLKKSDSGYLVINFDNDADVTSDFQKVILRNTQSGTNFLEIHKNIIDSIEATEQCNTGTGLNKSTNSTKESIIKDCPCNLPILKGQDCKMVPTLMKENYNSNNFNFQTSDSSSKYILLSKHGGQSMNQRYASSGISNQSLIESNELIKRLVYDENSIVENEYLIDATSSMSKIEEIPETKQLENYSHVLEQLYELGHVVLTLQIRAENKVLSKFESVIIQTLSGTIGVNLLMPSACFEHIPHNETKYPVCLSKTESDTFIINIDQHSEIYNAVLEKTIAGNIVLIPIIPQLKNTKNTQNTGFSTENSTEIFKLKVNSHHHGYVELPVVLKPTLSNNFIIILEKEFETRYKKTLQNDVTTKEGCLVLLKKYSSGYVLDLNTKGNIPPEALNALLVKSELDDIKILVQGPVFECVDTITSNRCAVSSAEVFGELLCKLQPSLSKKFETKYLMKPKFIAQKFASDTQLYERVKLQINETLCCTPSAVLKKTESGQYTVVLNKESKKTFLNNLTSFLASNPKGLVPVKRTQDGEIQINLNRYDEEKGHYGSLKITPSGNIYVIVDAQAVKNMTSSFKMLKKESNAVDTLSLIESVNQQVCTTCNAKPADGDCDISKCVCVELPFEKLNWTTCCLDQNTEQLSQPMCYVSNTTDNGALNLKVNTDKECISSTTKSQYKCNEQYYYVFDNVCSHSNNLHSSDFPKEGQQIKEFQVDIEYPQVGQVLWDSFSYLPPQLPPFLRDVRFR